MSKDKPRYLLTYIFRNEAEASMALELLKNSGIDAKSKTAAGTDALRIGEGKASLPFEEWGVYVRQERMGEAKEILDEAFGKERPFVLPRSKAREAVKPLVWVYLVFLSVFILVTIFSIVRYLMSISQ